MFMVSVEHKFGCVCNSVHRDPSFFSLLLETERFLGQNVKGAMIISAAVVCMHCGRAVKIPLF